MLLPFKSETIIQKHRGLSCLLHFGFCLQISPEPDSHPVAMSTSSLRRQVKNIVHNYSEAEIKVRGCFHLCLRFSLYRNPLSVLYYSACVISSCSCNTSELNLKPSNTFQRKETLFLKMWVWLRFFLIYTYPGQGSNFQWPMGSVQFSDVRDCRSDV